MIQHLIRCAFATLLLATSAAMAIDPMPFANAAEEERFRALTAELRCVLCQNQSLADSNAGIAKDLRDVIFKLMRDGKSDAEIKTFLVERYSDFVLYRPPMRRDTAVLWLAPFAIVLIGAITIVVIVRRRSAALHGAADNSTETNREEW